MVLQGVVSHVEACFGAFGGSVTLGTRWVHGLLLHDVGEVEARFGPVGDKVNLGAR